MLKKRYALVTTFILIFLLSLAAVQPLASADIKTLAVLPIITTPALEEQAALLTNRIASEISRSAVYVVVEADKRDTLIEELKFSLNDLSSDEVELKLGELLSAQFLISGSLGLQSGKYLLSLTLISVESGAAVRTVADTFSSLDEIYLNIPGITDELIGLSSFTKKRIETISIDVGIGAYPTSTELSALGAELGVLYRVIENVYVGGWVGGVMKRDTEIYLNGGIRALYGDKTNGFAISLDLGFFPSVGLYYRNFYVTYAPMFLFGEEGQYVKAGYSVGVL